MEQLRYSMLIQWSDEDEAYIVTLLEFPGCHTHGDTYEEALQNGKEVLEPVIENRQALGRRPLPEPRKYDAA